MSVTIFSNTSCQSSPIFHNRSRGVSNEHWRSECFCPLGQVLAWFTVHLMTRDVLMGPDSPVPVPLFTGQQTQLYQPDSDSRTSDTNKELLLQSVIQSVIQSKSSQSTPHCDRPYITAWRRDCVQHQYSKRYLILLPADWSHWVNETFLGVFSNNVLQDAKCFSVWAVMSKSFKFQSSVTPLADLLLRQVSNWQNNWAPDVSAEEQHTSTTQQFIFTAWTHGRCDCLSRHGRGVGLCRSHLQGWGMVASQRYWRRFYWRLTLFCRLLLFSRY